MTEEIWSAEALLRAKRMWRAGASFEDVRTALNSQQADSTVRAKLRKFGVRWDKPSNHKGTAKAVQGAIE